MGDTSQDGAVLHLWQFGALIAFAVLCYYLSIFLMTKAAGESTHALTAPVRAVRQGTAVGAGLFARLVAAVRGRNRQYVPLPTHDADFANEPAPSVERIQ